MEASMTALEDPRKRQPSAPFPEQRQAPPGLEALASAEASYVAGMIYGATGGEPMG
jgi:hypothetical protein